MVSRVLAVVVCYNPDIHALRGVLNALANQQCESLVIDNNSSDQMALESLTAEFETVEIQLQSNNFGLGAAHNLGIQYARQNGYSDVLLLDQDSVPLKGMVASLLKAQVAKKNTNKGAKGQKISALGATYLNADNGSESFFVKFGLLKFKRQYCGQRDDDGCIEADFLISSGSLISLDVFDEIGLMDEGLFIDHVDTEWFLRARNKGYSAYGVCEAVMQHGLGEATHRIALGGRTRNVPQHKPFRYYYIFRNSVNLYLRSGISWLWRWNDIQRLAMIAVMFGVFKGPRLANATMMWRGFWDGVRGRQGQLDSLTLGSVKSVVNDK